MVQAIFPIEGEKVVSGELLPMYEDMLFGLYTNEQVPTKASEIAHFNEATFSGYARVSIAWSAVAVDGSDRVYRDGPIVQFQHDGGPFTDNVWGFFVLNPAGDKVLWAYKFAAAKPMTGVTSIIQLVPRVLTGDIPPP